MAMGIVEVCGWGAKRVEMIQSTWTPMKDRVIEMDDGRWTMEQFSAFRIYQAIDGLLEASLGVFLPKVKFTYGDSGAAIDHM